MKALTINKLEYLRVLGVGLLSVIFVGLVIVLGWSHATSTSRIVGCLILAAAMLWVLRSLWIYRPHTTMIDESSIVDGPNWSATVLDRCFMFIDIRTENGKQRRVRYVTCAAQETVKPESESKNVEGAQKE